jgi:hypothetical protein
MATVSVTIGTNTVVGNLRSVDGLITGGTSDYVNGTGYTFAPSAFGLTSIAVVNVICRSGGFMAQWSVSSGSLVLKVFWPTSASAGIATEVTTGTNLTTALFHFDIQGS